MTKDRLGSCLAQDDLLQTMLSRDLGCLTKESSEKDSGFNYLTIPSLLVVLSLGLTMAWLVCSCMGELPPKDMAADAVYCCLQSAFFNLRQSTFTCVTRGLQKSPQNLIRNTWTAPNIGLEYLCLFFSMMTCSSTQSKPPIWSLSDLHCQ